MKNIHQQPYLLAVYHSTAAHRAATKPFQPCLSPPILVLFLQFCAMLFAGVVYSVLPLIVQCIANSQQPQRLNITCSCSDGELVLQKLCQDSSLHFQCVSMKIKISYYHSMQALLFINYQCCNLSSISLTLSLRISFFPPSPLKAEFFTC